MSKNPSPEVAPKLSKKQRKLAQQQEDTRIAEAAKAQLVELTKQAKEVIKRPPPEYQGWGVERTRLWLKRRNRLERRMANSSLCSVFTKRVHPAVVRKVFEGRVAALTACLKSLDDVSTDPLGQQ